MSLIEQLATAAGGGCCAAVYDSRWAQLLLGESLHPGGLALTERLGELLELSVGARVLDVACGTGVTAAFLAQRFGCQVVGVDQGAQMVAQANARAEEAGLKDRVVFQQGHAEALPFDRASFDAVLCECAFSTFEDKLTAAGELARVLRPGGLLGLSDLIRRGPLPAELSTDLGRAVCIGGAGTLTEYRAHLCAAGLSERLSEKHDQVLIDLIRGVHRKLTALAITATFAASGVAPDLIQEGLRLAAAAGAAARDGRLGYGVLVAAKA